MASDDENDSQMRIFIPVAVFDSCGEKKMELSGV
jgi:hypothetical protein